MHNHVIAWISTAPDMETAQRLAHGLLEQGLVACVTMTPGAVSMYQWQGRVETSSEVLLVIKSITEHSELIKQWWNRMHPYDVPELIALPVTDGLPAYLSWVKENSSGL